jgi:PAS domain S-box-containing protein
MSLRTKILLPLAFFSVLLLAYLYGYWMPRSLHNFEHTYRLSIERHLDSVGEELIPLLLAHELDAIHGNLNGLMKRNADWTTIKLTDAEGDVVYPLKTASAPSGNRSTGEDVRTLERSIDYDSLHLGKLVVGVDFAPQLARIRKKHWELMTVVLGIIAAYVVTTGFVLDWFARRPIILLSHASRRLAEGDYEAALPARSNDEVGILVNSFGSMRDTVSTSRRELLQERDRAQRYFDAAGIMMAVLDSDGSVVQINEKGSEVLGYGKSEIIGRRWFDTFLPERARDEVKAAFEKLMAGEANMAERLVTPVLTKSGQERIIDWRNTVLYSERGQFTFALSSGEDVTERKKAEDEIRTLNAELEKRVEERTADLQQKSDEVRESQKALLSSLKELNDKTRELEDANAKLRELDRLKSMFIASMSHELRTPLNSIIGFSSIMLNEWTGPLTAEQKDNLAAVLSAGRHLLALISDVIDVSKIEAGIIESITEDFDVFDVASEAARTFTADVAKKGLALDVQAVHLSMHGDRRRLLQCLLNLASNAVKFTEKGSIGITVVLSEDGKNIEIAVSDTGIGIRQEDGEKLFAPFVRLDSPLRAAVPGTGLGLYLTRKLIREVLHGEITFSSVEGKGSRFVLRVPLGAAGRGV